MSKAIFYSEDDGFWYFWDEHYIHRIGPFATEEDASAALKVYSESL